ncbi:BRCA1-associated ATM activator 1 isoform X2 [Tiliqua scincoides]|uniref:BRCA1-associated ATM activator 1 isoform X2 n=1 Tax=Tiliqua scincoides TaxID=71010 RepID=UPI0034621001
MRRKVTMDRKCSQLLPSVCAILAEPTHLVSDDTCLEKLLDWFKTLTETESSLLLLEENPCLTELILAVLSQEQPSPNILSFVLRLTGIFAASESSFRHLQGEVVLTAFGEAGPLGSPLWEDTSVRSGWVQGVRTMLQHRSSLQLLCDSGALEAIFTLQGDHSLFVASGASRLLAHLLIFSVRSELSGPLTTKDCDWPACARRIIVHIEESLQSHSASHIKQSLQVLTTLFEHSQDVWTEVLWSRIAETIETLLSEGAVQVGHSLVDLFLSMARSPAFSCHECSFWKAVVVALKCFSPAQVSPLALGLLKLEACPQAIKTQSLHILLQPMDCILRAASHSTKFSGLWDGPSAIASPVEPLLSTRSSCLSLLCQTLTHLEEIQHLACLSAEFPHQALLCSVVTVLQFCVGLAVPVSPLGVTVGKILIGSFRVQRAALSLLGALSRWATSGHDAATEQVSSILLAYLKCPDTSPTVLKKAFQAMLKWFLSLLDTCGATEDFQWHRQFLGHVLPVVQKRLCSPSWEARDSALEFLTLMAKHLRGQEWFWQVFSSSETLALAEGLLNDPESYVRASAVKASGQFSLMASVDSKTAGWDHNGSDKEASVAARLLEILSTDSEGFPRRAVIGVFTDWLREGHMTALTDPEQFLARVIQVVNGDLDWEVKVSGLELAEVFAAQAFGQHGATQCLSAVDSPPASQPDCLPEPLQTFCRVKLFDLLFGALGDCDRPVALKACKVLMAVKAKICKDSSPQEGQRSGLDGSCQLQETLGRATSCPPIPSGGASVETVPQDPRHVLLILESLDLEGLQRSLDKSSDYLENSPQSLLQDFLSARGDMEENEADCY